MTYPWQQQQQQQLWQAQQENRLSHALLFTGIAGTGKAKFAESFLRAILCAAPAKEGVACQVCHSCSLVEAKTHPNVLWVQPETAGQAIKVDQIRAVSEFTYQSALKGKTRIIVINPADNMNLSAANALLKTLEEPAADALLMLISAQSERLPATVRSRCQHIHFPRPSQEQALAWLKEQAKENTVDPILLLNLANGAPLRVLQLLANETLAVREYIFQALYTLSQPHADPIKLAAKIPDSEPLLILDFILSWVVDVLRLQLNLDMINKDYAEQLEKLCLQTMLSHNLKFLAYLQTLRTQISVGINLNKQLVMESILVKWSSSFRATDLSRDENVCS